MTPVTGDYSGHGEIVALCPSRENVEGAAAMVRSLYDTIERIHTEVIIVVDSNDPALKEYLAIPRRFLNEQVGQGAQVERPDPPRIMVVEGGSLTKATNEAVARIWDEDIIIGHVGDDHRFRTPGWDTRIRDALREPGVAYAFDGFRSLWASAWWTNSIIPRTLGWLGVPGSMHLTIDDVFMDIGAGLGRLTFLDDVLIEHLHPAGGKVPWRPIVASHYEKARRTKEDANLERYRTEDFARDINALQAVLGLPVTEVTDLAPGKTFRKNLSHDLIPDEVGPSLHAIELFVGGPVEPNSAVWVKARKLMRQNKPWHA